MFFPRVAACLLLLTAAQHSAYSRQSPVDLIPKASPLAVSITISGEDEGVAWLAKRLKTYLLSRYSGDEKIDDFTFLDVDELAFAVLPRRGGAHDSILAARIVDKGEPIRIKTGDHDIRINIRDNEAARRFKRSVLVAFLELLVEKGAESPEKVAVPGGDIEIAVRASSYVILGDNVVVGSSREAVKAATGASAHAGERLSSTAPYEDIGRRLFTSPADLVTFVDNRGDDFKKYVALCRAEWGPILLGMTESVDYLGLTVDIINSDSMKARVVTHSPDKNRAGTTQAAVEANLPLFLKKYLGGKIEHRLTTGRDGLYLTIDVDVSGLAGYWDRLFKIKEQLSDG